MNKGFEVLWDGEIHVEHEFGKPDVEVYLGDPLGMLYTTSGPFLWWGGFRFPSDLKESFPDTVPAIHRAVLGGRELVVAVYQVDRKESWGRLEVYHDPSVGYLPRLARYISSSTQGGICKEQYLIEARPCSSGGFVPTKVYEAIFDIGAPKHLDASEFDSQASPPIPTYRIRMTLLEATDFKDTKGPVGLERLENAKVIATKGGRVALTNDTSLTIDRVKKLLGRKLTDPLPGQMPPIDIAELNEFSEAPRSHWLAYSLGIGLALVIGVFGRWRWRRARAALVIAALIGLAQPGCSPSGKTVLGLTGAFDQTNILYSHEHTTLPLTLSVRNVGTVPLRLMNLDGGCACRRVDTSVLPVVIDPGKSH